MLGLVAGVSMSRGKAGQSLETEDITRAQVAAGSIAGVRDCYGASSGPAATGQGPLQGGVAPENGVGPWNRKGPTAGLEFKDTDCDGHSDAVRVDHGAISAHGAAERNGADGRVYVRVGDLLGFEADGKLGHRKAEGHGGIAVVGGGGEGELCAAVGTADVVDALVVRGPADRHDDVLTRGLGERFARAAYAPGVGRFRRRDDRELSRGFAGAGRGARRAGSQGTLPSRVGEGHALPPRDRVRTAGHDRLDLMALLWAVQLRSEVLSDEAIGLVGDAADALPGQCNPSQILLRLAHEPAGEAALVASAADAAARWRSSVAPGSVPAEPRSPRRPPVGPPRGR